MTRLFHTTLLAFATALILIPAASAMPVLSDSGGPAVRAPIPFLSPVDAAFQAVPPAQEGDGWYPAAIHRPGPVLGVDLSVPNPGTVPTISTSDGGRDFQPLGLFALSAALVGLLAVAARRRAQPQHVPILH